jgi:glyoxylate reductase
MSKPKVFVTRMIPEKGLEMIRDVADAEVWSDELPPSYEVLVEKVRGIDGLLSLLTDKIDDRLMDTAGKRLRVISQMAVGCDNIDIHAATVRGIPVGNTPGVLTETTADLAWALLMAAARRVVEGVKYARAGRWRTWGPTLLLGPDVNGATLGILGFGRIGQAVARRARGFNMRVLYHDVCRREDLENSMGVQYADLDTLYAESDFLTIHTDLNDATHHMIDDGALAKLKSTAILINTARGPIVEPEALYRALSEGKIAYAALDVTEPEPIPEDSPLLTLDNIIVTPHLGSASMQTRTKMATMAAANLAAGLNGERLPNCVNPEVYR